jgi:hypothetical protein
MAREQTQAANAAIGNADLTATRAGNQGNQVFGTDWSAIQGQINPSSATVNALTQLPQQAAGSAFDAAKTSATNRMARTRNTAGFSELTDKLARDSAAAQSTAALKGQEAVQNLENTGIENAGKLFGVSSDTMAKIYGTVPGLLDARAKGGGFNVGIGPLSFGTKGG